MYTYVFVYVSVCVCVSASVFACVCACVSNICMHGWMDGWMEQGCVLFGKIEEADTVGVLRFRGPCGCLLSETVPRPTRIALAARQSFHWHSGGR